MDGRTLYFECYSGISGDMAVAAMLDLGADLDGLTSVLDSLDLNGFRVEVSRRIRNGLDACDFSVVLDEDNHDHDDAYLYGDHHHGHDHGHGDHHHGHHPHRHLPEILAIIRSGTMTDRARSVAERMFTILAEAEASAHGTEVDRVHFHEVGAVDSIVDIVALAFCIDDLGIDRVCFSELHEGTGTVRCQHGIIPVPVPAVANIASAHGLRLRITGHHGEYVTPTGAAFAAAVGNSELPGSFRVVRVGTGAGKRETELPGIVRAMVLEASDTPERVCKLECCVDDCTGEALGFAMESLFSAGARDVFYTPVYMKKNRPAHCVTVICSEGDVPTMERILLTETSTIGVRRCTMERTVMDRTFEDVETPLGTMRVKVCSLDGMVRRYPEYDSLAALCRSAGIPYREGYDTVTAFLNGL